MSENKYKIGDFEFKVLTEKKEFKYKAEVYVHCLEMIKEMFKFVELYGVITKEYLDRQIDSFIKMFKDLAEGK